MLGRFQIVLLAAGKGTRMGSTITGVPKVLTPLRSGKTILETNLNYIKSAFPKSRTILVTGFESNRVSEFVSSHAPDVQVVYNPQFSTSGPITSIFTALPELDPTSPIAWANGDTVFSPRLLNQFGSSIQEQSDSVYLVVSEAASQSDDDLVVTFSNGLITSAVKRRVVPENPSRIISAGILGFHGDFIFSFVSKLVGEANCDARSGQPWHGLVSDLASRGISVRPVVAKHEDWGEYDYPGDLDKSYPA